jgi:hypothetical protein
MLSSYHEYTPACNGMMISDTRLNLRYTIDRYTDSHVDLPLELADYFTTIRQGFGFCFAFFTGPE